MVQAFYNLMGSFDSTYFDIAVFAICSIIVVYVFTCLMNILMSFFKG